MTQLDAIEILKTGSNVFLTGGAGSGKTYVLQRYIHYLKLQGKKVGITASTGVASTQLNGMTIHSWAGIGLKETITDSEIVDLLKRKYMRKRFKDLEVLIIDEISMLSPHMLDMVDRICKAFLYSEDVFGGLQVILCGDFFQLPPVIKNSVNQVPVFGSRFSDSGYSGFSSSGNKAGSQKTDNLASDYRQQRTAPQVTSNNSRPQFIYRSPVWNELDLKVCYLDKAYRQTDMRFLHMLDEIRHNSITDDTWKLLRESFLRPSDSGITPTKLYTHNDRADAINEAELAKINDERYEYRMQTTGAEMLVNLMKKSCLAPEQLVLKRGAFVMFVKNNFDAGYVNGTLGKIVEFRDVDGLPVVETFAGKRIVAYPAEWEIDEGDDMQAVISQIPLRLAWAITIHKSQGMTLDAAEIDLGKSFVEGMGYVALSRVRTLDGLRITSINRMALSVNDEVIRADKRLRELSEETTSELHSNYWYQKNHATTQSESL